MYAGQVVELGPSGQVFEGAHHPYSEALGNAYPRIGDQRFRYAPAACPATRRSPVRRRRGAFHPRCPVAREECKNHGRGVATFRRSPLVVLPVRPGGGHDRPVLQARGLEVTFRGRGNRSRAPSTAST